MSNLAISTHLEEMKVKAIARKQIREGNSKHFVYVKLLSSSYFHKKQQEIGEEMGSQLLSRLIEKVFEEEKLD
ncbi:MAG: hypothetical protein QNJ54_12390 [Prochloraceae cyanobacterium]|nr:hypothetical protein [Prochloraceae cyanobacterium]